MFTAEDLNNIRWLANLVKAQALSEEKQNDRMAVAYGTRNWFTPTGEAAQSKSARAQSVLDAVERMKEPTDD